mmetsp:Transcript_43696/g.57894  ORF Transcript_43696/g.57894 Transcript_43696/m.57894 type:complete len:97 (+) Transcript_43696:1374-1664(+)
MLLVLCRFFDFGGVHVACLLLFDFEDFTKSSAAESFDDFEAAFKNFLVLLEHGRVGVLCCASDKLGVVVVFLPRKNEILACASFSKAESVLGRVLR